MVAWILLLLLGLGEAGAFAWWLRKEFYPVFFSGWAALIYMALLFGDFLVAWFVSRIFIPGGSLPLAWFAAFAGAGVVAVFVLTLFFRWVVRADMDDTTRH